MEEIIESSEEPKKEDTIVDYIKDIIKRILSYKIGLSSLDSVKDKIRELKTKVESRIEDKKEELKQIEEKEAELGDCEPEVIQVPNESEQCAHIIEEYNKQLENRAKNVALLGEVLEIVQSKMVNIPKSLLVTYYDTESFFRGHKSLDFAKPILKQIKAKFLINPQQKQQN